MLDKTSWNGLSASHQLRKRVLLCITGGIIFLLLTHTLNGSHSTRYASLDKFPRKIWQSWKVEPLRFEDRDMVRARSWTLKNPGHRYEVLTDDNAVNFVEEKFGPAGLNRPDIVSTYGSLTARIIQADLLRYLVMYVEGGVYADIDVEALKPVEDFIPERYSERDVDIIIGIETDEPDFKDHPILGSKAQSFCQWTFACKPRHPVMMRLINNILFWLHDMAQTQGKPIAELEFDFDDVLSGTGPSAFTDAFLAEMSETAGEAITWEAFHGLTESKLVGGVLVLPAEAFAAASGHSHSGNHDGRQALVRHHYHASMWPSQHHRYRHPVYAEVERCNWNRECVELWDLNTAFFASLPEEQQLKMIALKDGNGQGLPDAKPEGTTPTNDHESEQPATHEEMLNKMLAPSSGGPEAQAP